MVPARKSQSRFKWLTTLAKFVTSNSLDLKNPQEVPTVFFRLNPKLSAYCSLRNSGHKGEKCLFFLNILNRVNWILATVIQRAGFSILNNEFYAY